MADLYVKKFDMINPFVVASSPATQGALNVLKSAKMRPGAIVLRNYGHGSGGGSFIGPDSKAMFGGEMAIHSHAVGRQIPDSVDTLEKYCEEVHKIKKEMDSDIKLWVSVGHYSDIVKGGDWEKNWAHQAEELALAGADAIELHFQYPGRCRGKGPYICLPSAAPPFHRIDEKDSTQYANHGQTCHRVHRRADLHANCRGSRRCSCRSNRPLEGLLHGS